MQGSNSVCGEHVVRPSLRNILFACFFACSLFLLGGCSTAGPSYYGIQLNQPTDALSEEQVSILNLGRLAQAGSKQAQLELGIRFEEGDGVPQDFEAARSLYSEAARDTQLKQTVFLPDGNGGVEAQTAYLGVNEGLYEAKGRLRKLGGSAEIVEIAPNGLSDGSVGRSISQLFLDSPNLAYVGKFSQPLLLDKGALKFRSGSQLFPDFAAEGNFCRLWGEHLSHRFGGGRLVRCAEYEYSVLVLSGSDVEEGTSFRAIEYDFDSLAPECPDARLPCDWDPLSHSIIVDEPLCGVVIFHVFEDELARRFAILTSTDPKAHGKSLNLNVLSDRDHSVRDIGEERSSMDIIGECKAKYGGVNE